MILSRIISILPSSTTACPQAVMEIVLDSLKGYTIWLDESNDGSDEMLNFVENVPACADGNHVSANNPGGL